MKTKQWLDDEAQQAMYYLRNKEHAGTMTQVQDYEDDSSMPRLVQLYVNIKKKENEMLPILIRFNY